MILDAQTLLAYFDRTHERHWSAAGEIELLAETERLVVSPFVVVELESLVRQPYRAPAPAQAARGGRGIPRGRIARGARRAGRLVDLTAL